MAQTHSPNSSSAPRVVSRSDIPISAAPEDVGLEVRPFAAHRLLGSMIPSAGALLAWTHAGPGQQVPLRSHPARGLLIVLQGSAELLGGVPRLVEQGDVVTIPKDIRYGFAQIGRDGLHAIHVTFPERSTHADGLPSFERLILRNEARARASREGPFFRLLQGKGLATEGRRSTFREALRVFSDAFQAMLLTRQAVCRDEPYRVAFEGHFLEELGHNTLLETAGGPRVARDPVLRATSSWFPHQMLALDNAGKATVHLVLETAGNHFHSLAQMVLADDKCAEYFTKHADLDAGHQETAAELLRGHNPASYDRLERVLEDAWDMFDAMSKRIAELVELEGSRS